MKALIVHAHPEQASFTSSMARVLAGELANLGYTVSTSDLYLDNFNPVASAQDFGSRQQENYLVYAREQRHNRMLKTLAEDIESEVEKVLSADLLILNFPIYWFSVPAILKGWIDRVFLSGDFYGGKNIYDRGGLIGRRAWVTASLGGRPHMFGKNAIHGELTGLLRHLLQGTLSYVGYDVLEPYFAFHVPYISAEERQALLCDFTASIADIANRPSLPMPSLALFDELFQPLSVDLL